MFFCRIYRKMAAGFRKEGFGLLPAPALPVPLPHQKPATPESSKSFRSRRCVFCRICQKMAARFRKEGFGLLPITASALPEPLSQRKPATPGER